MIASSNLDQNLYARGSRNLFEIWNKFRPQLPTCYYEEHMLRTADFLFDVKLYCLALRQGYGRYLLQYSSAGMQDVRDVEQLRRSFFPEGFDTEQAGRTGLAMCSFQLERARAEQPDPAAVQRMLGILAFLRTVMQAVLPHEKLCWLLYNGSLHIYNICRFLMSTSHSAQAVEFLLWACVCMETCVPLLSVRFLPWRCTLYCAVCQCYYSCSAETQAEVFARRALGKVNELGKLLELSGSPASSETQAAFKEATIKLAVMVFRRSVYEPRRRPKGLFRPRQKTHLKEVKTAPWPRSPTERVLMELFEGNAAQLLALMEALWDSSRRPLETGAPEEPEVQEVALELLSAGISILAGVGGSAEEVVNEHSLPGPLAGITLHPSSLLQLAQAGENRVSVEAAVRFVKLLFQYEQWDAFCRLSEPLLSLLQKLEDHSCRRAELELSLLMAAQPLLMSQRIRHTPKDGCADGGPERDRQQGLASGSDGVLSLVETLHTCVCNSAQDMQPDRDLVMDVVLFLWSKCKAVFRRVHTGHSDSFRRLDSYSKWVQTLSLLSEVSHACDLALSDPVAVAEMTLRLASVLESGVESMIKSGRKTAVSEDTSLVSTSADLQGDVPPVSKRSAVEQLQAVLCVVQRAVESVSCSRARCPPGDGTALYDTVYLQPQGGEESEGGVSQRKNPKDTSPSTPLLMDLHLEMLVIQHRVSLKLLSASPESVLPDQVGRNGISRAVFLMQKALLSHRKDPKSQDTKKLLEEAGSLLERAQVEERRLFNAWGLRRGREGGEEKGRVPPPPILLSRSHRSMTFTPAPYALDKQVHWYCLYGREATGVNQKVRLGDCQLLGTGEEVPVSGECVLRVEGLEPNQKYVFAVAAYDTQGQLVGGAIGDSSRPLLASPPLPLLTAWAHLAQASYQTGHYTLSKRACSELWAHFTHPPDPGASCTPEGLAQTRLRREALQHASPLLLQLLLASIFTQTDIHVQEGALYCDALSDGGPLIWGQTARLAECERTLVALDLALWLNDSGAALQGVVGCYGLLAPLIYHRIPSEAAVQVLMKCLAVLQEFPGVFRHKRQAATAESLLHMVACITYYLAKVLRSSREYRLASAVLEQGKKLLQEATEGVATQQGTSKPRPPERQADSGERGQGEKPQGTAGCGPQQVEPSEQLKALEANAATRVMADAVLQGDSSTVTHDLTGQEDPILLYAVINSSPLETAFKEVMKFKRRACFLEYAAQLLQRALCEDQLEQLLQWGQSILSWISKRDEGLTGVKKISAAEIRAQGGAEEELKKYTSSVIEYNKKPKGSTVSTDRKRKEQHRKQLSQLKAQSTERQRQALDLLLLLLPRLVRRQQRRRHLRQVCSEERPWRCHLHLSLATCHLTLLHRHLQQRHSRTEHSYSSLDPLLFSLAHCSTVVRRSDVPQHIRAPELTPPTPKPTPPPPPSPRAQPAKAEEKVNNTTGEESSATDSEAESDPDTPRTQLTNEPDCNEPSQAIDTPTGGSVSQLLDCLSKAALHFRRAMVLAHRGGHWTLLQWVCRVMWDQATAVTHLVEQGLSLEQPLPLSLEQLHSTLSPLLLLATDLLLDMMHTLQMWKLFEGEERELEGSLRFSAPVDDGTLVDLRWLRLLSLRTLELLALQGRWETLSLLALHFNHVTRERYAHTVTPLLVHAQRSLQERVLSLGGPQVPQPHVTHTETATGEKITCRNYTEKQLLLGWPPREEGRSRDSVPPLPPDAEAQRALCLVSVPLDVEDTLRCFREALERRPYVLQTFQHSRTLLLLLLAGTQASFQAPLCEEGGGQSQGRVECGMAAGSAPPVAPPDLSSEDFSRPDSIYSRPLPPSQLSTVISSYSNSIKYLEANNQNSLLVQALHDLGNLHFYNGNTRAAHSSWSRALDCALQCTGVLGSWDGVSWGSGPPVDVLQQAGVWGCLQGAILTAKIAQYLLTSDISQRTLCSLLSARLFKPLLTASLPHPQSDWQYSSYEPGPELIPGLDLFSEPSRAPVGAAVSSLAFLCHWLHSSGHALTVLPLLSLYLHWVGTVCRDPNCTIGGRILKVQVLTELGLLADAAGEMVCLMQGEGIPHGPCRATTKQQPKKSFDTSRPLLEPSNLQALQELVSGDLSSELCELFGPQVARRLSIARVQLILALCRSVHSYPDTQGQVHLEGQPQDSTPKALSSPSKDREESRSRDPTPTPSHTPRAKEPCRLQLDPGRDSLTPAKLKALLLAEASRILASLLCSLQPKGGDEELELAVETRLLLSEASLQEGKAAYSADLAVSALRLLQDSYPQEGDSADSPLQVDVPQAVEARGRMGAALWLRCRLAAVRALANHIPGTAVLTGPDSSTQADRLLTEGLQEAESWGDPDAHALLLLQGALMGILRGRPREDSTPQLQEALKLLSGRRVLSPRASLTLATVAVQLSDLMISDSHALLLLTQRLLQQQLSALGETVTLEEGGRVLLPPSGLRNMYLPQLPLLAEATLRLGQGLAWEAAGSPGSDSGQWLSAQQVLDSALQLTQGSAARDSDLETDILYCRGLVERCLVSFSEWKPQAATETFLKAISAAQSHSHNLQQIRQCYLEMAAVYLQQWEGGSSSPQAQQSPSPPPRPRDSEQRAAGGKRIRTVQGRALTPREVHLLHCWICVRAATQVSEASASCAQLCGSSSASGGPLQLPELRALPTFTSNDLLHPCGGLEPLKNLCSSSPEPEAESQTTTQLTWVQLTRYHAHILNLHHIATHTVSQRVQGLCSLAVDSSLGQRLAQLHSLFSALLPAYRGQCCAPQIPAALLQPRSPQTTAQPVSGATEETFPWACAAKEQLCLQWYRPALDPTQQNQNSILLLFAFNRTPLSALRPTSQAVTELRCGQRRVSLEVRWAVHAELCSLCVGASVSSPPPTHPPSSVSPKLERRRHSRSLEKEGALHSQLLQEKTMTCCSLIKALLNSDPTVITKVPFEPSPQTLSDLERCFNPRGGATVSEGGVASWLASLLL
ncbi:hypothetical protein MATL_G00263130 [Megalops atlanticus]|uniref:Cilia- and flagella-associated protein 54 n=1 Tax=Megalops atlanticus TaxID=7932 RepID=A0A9D3PBJ1_MEGAT|nr:hypothetical protein MATL_G00263130 [Megalops atlanticus]